MIKIVLLLFTVSVLGLGITNDSYASIPEPPPTTPPAPQPDPPSSLNGYIGGISNYAGSSLVHITIKNASSTVNLELKTDDGTIHTMTSNVSETGSADILWDISNLFDSVRYTLTVSDNDETIENVFAENPFDLYPTSNSNLFINSVTTDQLQYATGDIMKIYVSINIDNSVIHGVQYQIVNPDNNLIDIGQQNSTLSSLVFEQTTNGPFWMQSGEYTIIVSYNNDIEQTKIDFTSLISDENTPKLLPKSIKGLESQIEKWEKHITKNLSGINKIQIVLDKALQGTNTDKIERLENKIETLLALNDVYENLIEYMESQILLHS